MTLPTIAPAEVHARIRRGDPVDLIDVRSTGEWNSVHAVGARHVPLGTLDPAAVMAARVGKADDPIYLICASGGRSAAACDAFHRAGFPQAVNVAGGTGAWLSAGLPVERGPQGALPGVVRQIGIYLVVGAAILFLMPCSPLSLWGSAYCPATPGPGAGQAAAPPAAPAAAQPGSVDFARDVVAASAAAPVLVDFHATWCPPCRALAPEIEALRSERGDRLRVVQIDVDQAPLLAQAHGVSGIPDLRLWRGGKEVARSTGFRPRAELAAWIDASANP